MIGWKSRRLLVLLRHPNHQVCWTRKEKMFLLSLTRGGRPPEDNHPTKIALDPPKIITRFATRKLVIQIILLLSTKILLAHTQMPSLQINKIHLLFTKLSPILPYSISHLPKYCSKMCQCAVKQQSTPTSIKFQAPVYQNAPTNYQNWSPYYQKNPYPRNQAPCPNTQNYE